MGNLPSVFKIKMNNFLWESLLLHKEDSMNETFRFDFEAVLNTDIKKTINVA